MKLKKKKHYEQLGPLDPEAIEAVKKFNKSPEGKKAKQVSTDFAKTIQRLKRSAELARSKDVVYMQKHAASKEKAETQVTKEEIKAMYLRAGVTPKNKNRVTTAFGRSYTFYSSSPNIATTTPSTPNNRMIRKTK